MECYLYVCFQNYSLGNQLVYSSLGKIVSSLRFLAACSSLRRAEASCPHPAFHFSVSVVSVLVQLAFRLSGWWDFMSTATDISCGHFHGTLPDPLTLRLFPLTLLKWSLSLRCWRCIRWISCDHSSAFWLVVVFCNGLPLLWEFPWWGWRLHSTEGKGEIFRIGEIFRNIQNVVRDYAELVSDCCRSFSRPMTSLDLGSRLRFHYQSGFLFCWVG